MKRLCAGLVMCFMAVGFSAAHALELPSERAILGDGNVAFKMGYIHFSDSVLEDSDVNQGLYIGGEAYFELAKLAELNSSMPEIIPGLYLGMELGWAHPEGKVTVGSIELETALTYFPIEYNIKYALKPLDEYPEFNLDIGAGLASVFVEEEIAVGSVSLSEDGWLFGGQFFADLNYDSDPFFVGAYLKYQLTGETDEDYNYNNFQVGGHVGYKF